MPFNQHKFSIHTKQSWLAVRSRFLNKFSSSSGRTYLRRQSGFAAERKQQTCATQENGSPALQLDDLGWGAEILALGERRLWVSAPPWNPAVNKSRLLTQNAQCYGKVAGRRRENPEWTRTRGVTNLSTPPTRRSGPR
ncbi:hypothetical protein NQZ68_008114 [Dissostichus eleginoides]|nr:hypothetical protein NQZ68_008114 [Dissostichus eleginoides]